MQDLIKQEQFEIGVLDKLNSRKLLNNLVFCGGSMLRLCYELNRFSVDLDFWLTRALDVHNLYNTMKECLEESYTLSDTENKFYTLLFDIRSKAYPRSLKVEVRKQTKKVAIVRNIAYSKYANTQVLLNTVSLKDMMNLKIGTFIERKEIRDVFDIEFLLRKGIELPADTKTLNQLSKTIASLTKRDYTVKLGSLLDDDTRKYYVLENFKTLKLAINEKLK